VRDGLRDQIVRRHRDYGRLPLVANFRR
jgi:hypothetical protein